MNKEEYLKELRSYLNGISKEEIEETILDIEEYFEEGINDGRSEVEISKALGKPKVLAYTIKMESDIESMSNENTFKLNMTMISKIIGLGFANIITMPIFLSIGVVILAMYSVVFSLYISSGVMILSPLIENIAPKLVNTGNLPIYSFVLLGLGLMYVSKKFHELMDKASKKGYEFLIKYIKANSSFIKN